MSKKILFLPGDGIGPEVCAQAKRIVHWFNDNRNTDMKIRDGLIGGAAHDAHGDPFPEETQEFAKQADAILLGAVGGPKYDELPFEERPERGLLGIRKLLGLFANLRPAIVFDELVEASTLKPHVVKGLDMLIVRELTGGIYFGEPKGVEDCEGGQKGYNTLVYTTPEIERIARVAFDLAKKRDSRVCSVDKANVLVSTGLWRDTVQRIHDDEYADTELSHMYVDNAAMQLVRYPKQFDVMVTTNMFGDILSDCAAMLTGSLGMLPSASLGAADSDVCNALYEPVHGSAPDIAGQNMANPLATILSLGMMLRYSFDLVSEADLLEMAVRRVLAKGYRTGDILQEDKPGLQQVGTSQMGDAILEALDELNSMVDSLAEAEKQAS